MIKIAVSLISSIFLIPLFLPYDSIAEQESKDSDVIEQLPTVTVTASPLAPSLLEYGKPASVMNKRDIEKRSATTLGETIELEPGVRSSFFGAGSSRPIIRGFSGDRVKVMRGGVNTGDVSNLSEDHVVVADPLQAEQIEILRGPETLLYGNSAIGGAVNVTDDAIAESPIGKALTGEILGQLGDSADNEKTAALKLKGEVDSINWHISGFNRRTSSYEIPGFAESEILRESEEEHMHTEDHHEAEEYLHDEHEEEEVRGKVNNTDTESFGGTIGLSHTWEKGFLGLSVSGFRSDYGIPGHSHAHEEEGHEHEEETGHHDSEHDRDIHLEDDHEHHEEIEIISDEHGNEIHGEEEHSEEEQVKIEAKQHRADIRGKFKDVSNSIESIAVRVGASSYEHKEIEGDVVGTIYDRDMFDSRLEFAHSPIGDLSGAFGLQFLYDDFTVSGEEAFLPNSQSYQPAFFAYEKLTLTDTLALDFGGRIESVSHKPENHSSSSFIPFSVSAGPVWDLAGEGEYSLALNFAYSERAPTTTELYANGAHIARQIFEFGSEDLDKEASYGVDLVFRKNDGIITGSFTPFIQKFNNFINLAATGEEEDELPIYNYEEVEANFWGFEYVNTLNIDRILDLGSNSLAFDLQLDYTRARDTDNSTNLPRIPPLRTITRARYGYLDSFEAMIEGVFVQEQDKTAPFELETGGYNMLNAEVSVSLPTTEAINSRLFARASNLTDDEARVHSSFLKDLAPLRGRSFLFGIKGTF